MGTLNALAPSDRLGGVKVYHRYDAILGTPFLSQHNVVLDFGARALTIDGVNVPVYTEVEEAEVRREHEERKRRTIAKYMLELAEQTEN